MSVCVCIKCYFDLEQFTTSEKSSLWLCTQRVLFSLYFVKMNDILPKVEELSASVVEKGIYCMKAGF